MAIPIAAGLAGAGGAVARFAGARANANALMPEGFEEEKARLERLKRAGEMGLSETDLAAMEQQGTMMRGGALSDANARQLQQAQMMAGSGAVSGRDLYLNEVTNQEMQQKALSDQAALIQQRDAQEKAAQEAQLLELQQREASSDAARKSAGWDLVGGLVGAGASAGIGVAGANQFAQGQQALMQATAGTEAYRKAVQQLQFGQMAMGMAGAFGSGAQTPTPQVVLPPTPQVVLPPTPQVFQPQGTNPMLADMSMRGGGPNPFADGLADGLGYGADSRYVRQPDGSYVFVPRRY